ncbi:hypothetical protein P154DRAFT_436287 [Amniculicola lignicola CBS 123094]|uniref:Mediator complex subunit 15 KIX domain-containing protein n=1 Tax=Amniculicola lignicola CBS 123094 TaxID=1392246 RepID=A0A6A5WDL8_9PLEO|nr:hypothetical protein P154DRAFT_436287 [Amniculicola lignicola CBS 123094]
MNNPAFQQQPAMNRGIQNNFYSHYRQQQAPEGWQQSVPAEERAGFALQFFTSFKLLKPDAKDIDAVRHAISFETRTFMSSASKDAYNGSMRARLLELQAMRQRALQNVQQGMQNNNGMAQMNMMGQPGGPGQRPNQPQQFPGGFPNPQLQRPMQASPIPMSQGPSSMGMNMQPGQNTPQPNMQQLNQPQRQMLDNQKVSEIAQRMMNSAKPEILAKFRQDIETWPADRRQALAAQNVDPMFYRFRQHAEMMIRSGRLNIQGAQPQNPNGSAQAPGLQNQIASQQALMNMAQRQPNQDFDFAALTNQQIEAQRVQQEGQQVVPASNNVNNTQMFQNQQPGQPQNTAMAQQRAQVAFNNATAARQAQVQAQAQQQAQQQAQAPQAQAQAQAQVRNANQMLQGQIGGLNLPPGTQQSPAMPMLTRPMIPPGQPAPTTPQQRPQNHIPQMTPQGPGPQVDPQVATQLMREAQQRAAAAAQGQPLTDQARLKLLPTDMAPEIRQQMMGMPEHQFKSIVTSHRERIRRNAAMNGQFPGGQQQGVQQGGMMMNQAQMLGMGSMNGMMNTANMTGMRGPGMPLGQQPNGLGGSQLSMNQQQRLAGAAASPHAQRLAAAHAMLQQNPGIITNMDDKPFLSNILNPQVRTNLPQEVKTWAQLKQWASNNPGMMSQQETQKLLLFQVLQFQEAFRQNRQQQPGQQMSQQNNPGVIAPPQAQMNPNQGPNRPPQQPNMLGQAAAMQITAQDLMQLRQQLPPHQANTSDDSLRNYIISRRMQARKDEQQRQMMVMAAARNQAQQNQPQMPPQAQQISRPPTTQPQPVQPQAPTPQPRPVAKVPQPPKATQPALQNNLNKGVKRPNDDSAEVQNNEPASTNAAPQAPPMVPSKSNQGLPNLTQEQLSRLTPAQQQHMRAQLLKAQDASNNKAQQRSSLTADDVTARIQEPARKQKYNNMIVEEDKNVPRGPVIQISPEARANLQQFVREKLPGIKRIELALRFFVAGYETPESDALARNIARGRAMLLRNMNPVDGTLHKDLTMEPKDFEAQIQKILQFVGRVMSRYSNQNQQANAAASQQNQPRAPASDAQPGKQHQLNEANLKRNEEEEEQRQRQRKQMPPSAPTTDRPPFQLGGQSPSGAPQYFVEQKITNLVLPDPRDKKKQKLDSGSPQAVPKGSPRGKGSPDLRRQPQPQKPAEQKPAFKCQSADCDYSIRGFFTQAELETHMRTVHAKIENPLQFAMDSMAEYLDVDSKTGAAKQEAAVAIRSEKPPSSSRVPQQPIKAGQTPSVAHNVTTPAGHAAATPMTRIPTQTGIKSSPSTGLLKTPQTGVKVATPSTGAPAKATPASVTKPATKEAETFALLEPEKEETQPFVPTSLFDFSYDDIYGALDSNPSAPFTVLDLKDEDNSWALRSRPSSPTTTPESSNKDTPSTRQSDISENDNLHINIDMKGIDVPEGWFAAMAGDPLPLDMQLSEDLQTLGMTLPPMDNDDMMLFYGESMNMDLDLATLDPTML